MEKYIEDFISTEIQWIPINKITVKNEIRDVIIKFFESLDDDEDIQNFYTNVDLNI